MEIQFSDIYKTEISVKFPNESAFKVELVIDPGIHEVDLIEETNETVSIKLKNGCFCPNIPKSNIKFL